MSTPFLAEIKVISFNFPPKGWAFCNGQLLQINQNQALFAILGTTYGGDGIRTFALPNFQGRSPFHVGGGNPLGSQGGEAAHTLIINEMAKHTHVPMGTTNTADAGTPGGNCWAAQTTSNPYSSLAPNGAMLPAAIANNGGSQPHNNMQPYLVVSFVIALVGVFPSRN